MDKPLIDSIVRLCQSEYIRHNPRDSLLAFLLEHRIGSPTGNTHRVSTDDKVTLSNLLKELTGVDAFSVELGGAFMRSRPAIMTPLLDDTQYASYEHPTVMIRQFNDDRLMYGDFTGRLPPKMSLNVHADVEYQAQTHKSVILVRHYDAFESFNSGQLDTSQVKSPMVVYAGTTSNQQEHVIRFLRMLNLPVHFFGDLSIGSLLFAHNVPKLAEILLPSPDQLNKIIERHNDVHRFETAFYACEKNLGKVNGPIGQFWTIVTENKLHIAASHLQGELIDLTQTVDPESRSSKHHTVPQVETPDPTASKPKPKAAPANKKKVATAEELNQFKPTISDETFQVIQTKQRAKTKEDKVAVEIPTSFVQYRDES